MSRSFVNGFQSLSIAKAGAWIAAILLLFACTCNLNAQVVATYSFDDGTADGWTSFNGASTPTATTTSAYNGSYSLLTTTGAGGTGGPSVSLNNVLLPGAKYTITGYVQLTTGESATNANFTIRRTDPSCSGGTCYDTVGAYQVGVSASGWAQIGGSYTVSATETAATLYAQLIGPTSAQSFYLDDVVITETAPPPAGTPLATYNFEDGGLDGWAPFGSATLTNAAPPVPDPNGDMRSLLTTNRTASYTGPSLNLLNVNNIVAGATYQVTAYILLAAPDSSNPTATLSLKNADCANLSGAYSNLATSGALSSTAWTKVQGTFSFSNLPGPPTGLLLYIQSSSATDSFYVDGVTISETSPPPPNPSQQDNTGIASTFEDGGLDGWSSRTGSSTVANSTATAHTGSHSLLTTGRVANYDGPQISVSDKMYVGSVYNLSVWVKTVLVDGGSHVINMSLQTTLDGTTSYPSLTPYPGITVPDDGNWHQISVNGYTMANAYDPGMAFLYLQTVPSSGSDLVSFYIDDFQLTYVAPPAIQTNIPSIYKTLSGDFPVGAAIDSSDLSGTNMQLLAMHFNSITSENDMKWSSVEPSLGSYTYDTADSEVGLAVCNDMLVRGQNLVWATGQQTPAYAYGDGTNSPANKAVVTSNIQEHIQSEVQHFGAKVYAWDVINEPIDPTQSDCLVHGPFYQVLGKSYIDVALRAARQYAPPGTKLFINEYSTSDQNRLDCLIRVVQDLRNRGIPLDGIGHETHSAINYPSVEDFARSIDTLAAKFPGIDQQVTEMDISVYNAGDTASNYGNDIPPDVLAEQGWLYQLYFNALKVRLKGVVSAVTLWGFADNDTWLDGFPVVRTDYPLPFDMNLQAKPAYWGIVDPTQLPGYQPGFHITDKSGPQDAKVWTVTVDNNSTGPAYDMLINGITLTQVSGDACTPVITPPGSFPFSLGDVPAGGSANVKFTINFAGCQPTATFKVQIPWSSVKYNSSTAVWYDQCI